MKLLHTSDWHIGHVLYDYDRSAEFQSFFAQLSKIVAEEKPDLMLVTGDIFNVNTPSAASQKLFTDGLLSVHQANPAMPIFLTAGNHDSPSRLSADASLWLSHNVHIIGSIKKDADGNILLNNIIHKIPGLCILACIPYFSENVFPVADVYNVVSQAISQQNKEALPVIMSGHLYIKGCQLPDARTDIGGLEFSPISAIGNNYDYLALGHIHRPQFVANTAHKARYCGTPIAISFDEDHPHCVDIIDLEKGISPNVRNIQIITPIQLLNIPSAPAPLEEALKALSETTYPSNAYVRLNVLIDDYLPADAQARASQLCQEKNLRFCTINAVRKKSVAQQEQASKSFTMSEFQHLDPLDVALMGYKISHDDQDMSPEMLSVLKTIISEAK